MPLLSSPRCSDGKFRPGNSVVCGTPWLRSTPVATVVYFGSAAGTGAMSGWVLDSSSTVATRSPGAMTMVWSPRESHFLPAAVTSAAVADSITSRLSRKQPGSPVYTAHSASASALPPKPPMRSMPRTKPALNTVRACSSSEADGPSASSLASSSSSAFSTVAMSTPCFTSTWMKNRPPSRLDQAAVETLSASLSWNTRRLSRRELREPPSTCDSSCRRSTSAWPYSAVFQAR